MVLTERKLGYDSRLVTLFHDQRNYYEDICLQLPFIDFSLTKLVKKWVSDPKKITVDNVLKVPDSIPIQWRPHSLLERLFVTVRDLMWYPKIHAAIKRHKLYDYDVYQLDGGLGLFRHSWFIKRVAARGKKIICLYTGSDLRTRGVIPVIDRLSTCNLTVEFDHIQMHPHIHHVFFPFDAGQFQVRVRNNDKIRIGHAPTNRKAKGSDIIIPILKKLAGEYNVEPVIIQNMLYPLAIETKQTCDIFVDQIGDLGYGINSLEALAMGIPCCSCLAAGFEKNYPDHPFVQVTAETLEARLIDLINDPERRRKLAAKGREWVVANHNAVNIVRRIHELSGTG